MSRSAVSVVIPTYNRAALLVRAVQSVIAAVEEGDEIIVVDDGSSDNTQSVLAPLRPRIDYIKTTRGGAGKARNIGVRAARNPLVAFLDSDDEWFADKVVLQKQVMAACPEALFCFSDFGVRGTPSGEERRYLENWHKDPRPWDEILGPARLFSTFAPLPGNRDDFRVHVGSLYLAEMLRPYILTSTFMVRRDAASDAIRFAEDVATFEDWECFGRVAGAGLGAYLDCETAWQWGHAGPRLTDTKLLESVTASIDILTRVWGADAGFLEEHGEAYRAKLNADRLLRLRCLLSSGKMREARDELQLVDNPPLLYRLLALMPSPLPRMFAQVRRHLRGKSKSPKEFACAGSR